jgi:hypothetical protein
MLLDFTNEWFLEGRRSKTPKFFQNVQAKGGVNDLKTVIKY